jgi:hypothetical protein
MHGTIPVTTRAFRRCRTTLFTLLAVCGLAGCVAGDATRTADHALDQLEAADSSGDGTDTDGTGAGAADGSGDGTGDGEATDDTSRTGDGTSRDTGDVCDGMELEPFLVDCDHGSSNTDDLDRG